MKYRQKPMEVDAVQYDGDFKNRKGEYYVPDWAVEAFEKGKLYFDEYEGEPGQLLVKSINGCIRVSVGDYVIKDELGAVYSCNRRVFAHMYEPAESEGK